MSDRSFSVKCIYSLFWETKLCIISNGCHLGYTGRVDGHNFGLEGNNAWTFFGPNLVSYDSVVLKKNTFKDFQFFNLSKSLVAIFDVCQGYQTCELFWKRAYKDYHNQVLSNLDQWLLRRRLNCKKLTDHGWMPSDRKCSLEVLALVS